MKNQLSGPKAANVIKHKHVAVRKQRTTETEILQPQSPVEADFPVGVLPEKLAHMVTAMSACYQVPPSLPAGALLATVAASIGRGLKVESGPDRATNPNLFVLASAGSGVGKSTTINDAVAPLRRMQAALRSGELKPQFEVPEKCEPTLTVDDVTGAALPCVMAANDQKIFAVSAEAGDLLKETSNRGNKLKSVLLKGYSNEPIEVHRVSRTHVSMDRPSIAVLWMCQPHRLDEFLAQPHLLESGLLARFLVMHSGGSMPSLTGNEPKVPRVVKAAYEGVVEELFKQYFQQDARSLKVRSPEKAQAMMRDFHNQVEARASTDRQYITACICRWQEQAWRLALVLHASIHGKDSHKHQLAVATATNAIQLARWFGDQQLRILNAIGSQRQTQRMRKLLCDLQNSPEGELTLRDLRNSHGFSSEEVEELVAAFPDRFRIEVIQNPNGGPKSHLLCPA